MKQPLLGKQRHDGNGILFLQLEKKAEPAFGGRISASGRQLESNYSPKGHDQRLCQQNSNFLKTGALVYALNNRMAASGLRYCCVGRVKSRLMAFKSSLVIILLLFIITKPLKAQAEFLGDYKAVFKTACKETMTLSSSMPWLQDFTVCVQLKLTSDHPWTAFTYKENVNSSSPADSYELGLLGDSGNVMVWMFGTQIQVSEKLSLHTWYHICITWENKKADMVFYINGKSAKHEHLKGNAKRLAGDGLLSLGCSQYPGMNSSAVAVGLVGELYLFRMWDSVQTNFEGCVDGNIVEWNREDWVYSNSTLEKDVSLQCANSDNSRSSMGLARAARKAKLDETTTSPSIITPVTDAVASLLDLHPLLDVLNLGKNKKEQPVESTTSSSVVARVADTVVNLLDRNAGVGLHNGLGNGNGDVASTPVPTVLTSAIPLPSSQKPGANSIAVSDFSGRTAMSSILSVSSPINITASTTSPQMNSTDSSCVPHFSNISSNFSCHVNGTTQSNDKVCNISTVCNYSFLYFVNLTIQVKNCSDAVSSLNLVFQDFAVPPDNQGIYQSNSSSNSSFTPVHQSDCIENKSISIINYTDLVHLKPNTGICRFIRSIEADYNIRTQEIKPIEHCCCSNLTKCPSTLTDLSNYRCDTSQTLESCDCTSVGTTDSTTSSRRPPSIQDNTKTTTTLAPPSNGTSGDHASNVTALASPSTGTSSNHPSIATTLAPFSNGTSNNHASNASTLAPSSNGTSSNHPGTATVLAPFSTGTSSDHASNVTPLAPLSNGTSSDHASNVTPLAPLSNGTSSNHASNATTLGPSSNGTSINHPSTATALAPLSNGTSSNHPSTATALAPLSNGTSSNHPSTATTTRAPNSAGTLDDINNLLNSNLNASMVEMMVATMESMLNGSKPIDSQLAGSFVNVVNNFLNVSSDLLAPVSNRLIGIVDTVGLRLNFSTESINLTSSSLALAVTKVNASSFSQTSFAIEPTPNLQVSLGKTQNNGSAAVITLPSSLLTVLSPTDMDLASRIQFNFFAKTSLFKNGSEWNMSLISSVISSSVANLTLQNLQDNVTVILKTDIPQDKVNNTVHCVFWNLSADGGKGSWSTEGCVVNSSGTNETVCKCNHLTSFGVLLDLSRQPIISPLQVLILTFITYIGCGLSAIFLSVTLVTYLAFEKIRRDYPSKILIQLCTALLLLNIVFLLDSWIALFGNIGMCAAVAAFLHYFLLVSFTWMGLEAFHMYLALVKVFNTYVRKYMLKFCIVGWGLPAVIVAIVVAIGREKFYYRGSYGKFPNGASDDFCWIQNDVVFYISVVGYFCLIFLINSSMFVVVIIQLCRIKKKKQLSRQRTSSVQDLRSVAGLMFLLGTTWGFAFFAWGPVNLPFMYLFAIFNTLQGFFIFLFYCVGKENVRKQWRRYLCCGRFRLAENSDWSRTATNGVKKQTLHQGASSSSILSTSNGNSTGSANSTTMLVKNDYSAHPNGDGPFCTEANSVTFNLPSNHARFQKLPGDEGDAGSREPQATLRRASNKGNIHFSD
ncbi:adhesion G-protein coupled receptor G2 isoform X2 [Rhinatrema bivittatum]|uniref:adhesion G-protein coupled receptor G2 isoform X2 n=1 Tax=Rhinatrema bivittatum TaxID=194408 RepID=UPI00112EAED0|nr:adhesion G-protein coupled receptor G2 isoform X2 [Rhinatrema bivittatum]